MARVKPKRKARIKVFKLPPDDPRRIRAEAKRDKIRKKKLKKYQKSRRSRRPRQELTSQTMHKKKQEAFLKVLALTGKVVESARYVGYASTTLLHQAKKEDKEFAKAWDLALEAAGDHLEEEALRRAVHGTTEDIYYKGEVVGQKINYSDSLLMFLLKGLRPEKFRDSARGANVNVKFGVAVLPMTAKNENQWEQNALDVHSNQEIIQLDEKPTESMPLKIKRGE